MPDGPRIFISTGELSGDYHAANLVHAIRSKAPDTVFMGVGSHNMASAGVKLLYESSSWGSIGIWQNLRKAPKINQIRQELIKKIPSMNLDLVIVVDYRVFHASLLKGIRGLEVGKLYYFAPVVWPGFKPHSIGKAYSDFLSGAKNLNPLLGKETRNRFEALSELADKLIVAYPFALEDYQKAGANVEFVGHPLMNVVKTTKNRDEVREELGIGRNAKLIGIFPGSRDHELEAHLPVLKEVIVTLKKEIGDVRFYMPIAHPAYEKTVKSILGSEAKRILFVKGDDYNIFAASDIALSKTGTSVQVLMALGVPTVAFYTVVSSLWYNVSIRYLVRFDYIAFPNVLAGRKIIPEFIQDSFKPSNLVNAVRDILKDDVRRAKMSSDLLEVRNQLYRPDALERAADIALDLAVRNKKKI